MNAQLVQPWIEGGPPIQNGRAKNGNTGVAGGRPQRIQPGFKAGPDGKPLDGKYYTTPSQGTQRKPSIQQARPATATRNQVQFGDDVPRKITTSAWMMSANEPTVASGPSSSAQNRSNYSSNSESGAGSGSSQSKRQQTKGGGNTGGNTLAPVDKASLESSAQQVEDTYGREGLKRSSNLYPNSYAAMAQQLKEAQEYLARKNYLGPAPDKKKIAEAREQWLEQQDAQQMYARANAGDMAAFEHLYGKPKPLPETGMGGPYSRLRDELNSKRLERPPVQRHPLAKPDEPIETALKIRILPGQYIKEGGVYYTYTGNGQTGWVKSKDKPAGMLAPGSPFKNADASDEKIPMELLRAAQPRLGGGNYMGTGKNKYNPYLSRLQTIADRFYQGQ